MQKSKEREYPIPFHNDVFFKYMLIGEDAGSAMLRSRIIEEIYGLKVQKTQVLNPELLPEAFFGKRAVLDVVLEDETGHLYDLEMQVSGYTKEEQLRFQQYGYRLAGRQLKQGNDYTKLKPFYQIIFMNYKPKDTGRMIRHYTVKDEDNREEPNGTLHRAIVFLPMIRQRVKEVGGIENLTEFETFCYVLAYNPDDAILNMKRRMVNVAMKKYNEMREDGSLYSWAESVEFAQRAVQANLEEQTAEAEKSGLERGFKQGLQQGLQQGLDEGKRTLLQSLIVHKYGIEDEWVESLSDQQKDDAVIQILDCDTYEALKERLKNKEMK
ncbi:transposase [[Clostridium] innocuum]|uniref:Transposase n=2 Tax=Bacillota TaxID=1239 RepID=A0A099I696_CLOIN|nr:PD-(D/E)XK nuclease family transposase [[Clostridium] innocuum]KGJ52792.1 transposase [[Clostridium] innocuum]MCR0160765.1 Rpn family recombination-promoting nuclease/putative transposase [[Clostridium] innocuum]MCR0485471.1 Rpn family recombination-promoting nuclease/putative transposase [[Clostridium] innocuum]